MKKYLLIIVVCLVQSAHAQSYTIDYTFEHSHNSRIEQNGKFGLIDQNNNLIIPAKYDEITDLYHDYARVAWAGKVGFVNSKAKEIIPCVYDRDTQMITGAVIKHEVDQSGDQISIVITKDPGREGFNEGLVCVVQKSKYGFINKKNKTIIPFQFDGADNFYNGIAIIKQKDKYGAINKTGKIVLPVIYDLLVWEIDNASALYVKKNGKCYYMDKNQKKVRNCWE